VKRPKYAESRFRRGVVNNESDGIARVTWVTPGDRLDPFRRYIPETWERGWDSEAERPSMDKMKDAPTLNSNMLGKGASWYGRDNRGNPVETWEQVQSIQREGWEEGDRMLRENRQAIMKILPQGFGIAKRRRRTKRYGSDGSVFNPEHRGDMERAWISRKRDRSGFGPIVSLIYKSGFNSNQTAKNAAWVPVAPLILCEQLEEAGYSVELVSMNIVKHGERSKTSVEVIPMRMKGPDEPFRRTAMTAAMHPAMHRTVGFMELCLSDTPERIDSCLGSAWTPRDGDFGAHYPLEKFGFSGRPIMIPQAFSQKACKDALTSSIETLFSGGN
jgi:hypothetical protein